MNKTLAKKFVRFLPFRIIYRATVAIPYFASDLVQALRWSLKRTETSNFYYDLTEKNIQELAHTISLVARIDVKQSRAYIDEIRGDRELASHIRSTLSADKSMSDSTMLLGRRIGWYALIRSLKPKTVVETGVHQGIGAVTIIRALEKNSDEGFPGKYFGTDIDPDAGVLITGSFLATGKVLYGDSIETLKQFTEEIDVFVNDSDHSADYEAREYEVVQTKLAKSAVILGDNSHATSSLVDFSFKNNRGFVLFREEPKDHWYPGAGIGISY